ncbi:MAG TPA: hypothetical protein VLB09_07065, partial [Nitrospiria bacterium]|nr:hypothetical protein [Nitrospiria bacterium]
SPLKGKYNTLVFGINYKGVNHLGRAMHEVFSESSLVQFFPEGFSPLIEWPVFTLELNRRITREVISPDCRVLTNDDPGTFWTGFFGTRDDGRFYAFLPGVGGSFQGAVSADGSMFAGAMIDHPRGHWIIIGFRDTGSNIPFLTQTGVAGGAPAHYALATYFLDLFIVGRPENNDTIRTQLSIESAFTESENNDRFFVGASGSSNFVTILNPFGLVTVPQSPGPVYRDNIGSISVFDVFYQSMAGGIFQLEREGLSGGILSDGSAFNFIRNTNISSNGSCQDELGRDIGFGLSLRQKPAGTYSVGNFSGSYIMAGIGDRYDFDLTANRFFSTLHRF